MMKLERGMVYSGSGDIMFNGEKIGTASGVDFTVTGIGFKTKKEDSCYGTINGEIATKGLIPKLNSPHPTPLNLELSIEGEKLVLKSIKVIDSIPRSGKLKETEFHGPWKD